MGTKIWCPKRFGSRETFMTWTARAAIAFTLFVAGSALAQQTPSASPPATPPAAQPATPPAAPPPIDFSKVEVKTTDLGDGVYMLEGAGGNITVALGTSGIIMVDGQDAPP